VAWLLRSKSRQNREIFSTLLKIFGGRAFNTNGKENFSVLLPRLRRGIAAAYRAKRGK
jgi:hypothetical protein